MIDFLIDVAIVIGIILGLFILNILFVALGEYTKGYREYRKITKKGFRIGGHFIYKGMSSEQSGLLYWKERYITSFDLLNRNVYFTKTRYYKSFEGSVISHCYERECISLKSLLLYCEPVKSKPRGVLAVNVDKEIRL